jgi:hypothetical protein
MTEDGISPGTIIIDCLVFYYIQWTSASSGASPQNHVYDNFMVLLL